MKKKFEIAIEGVNSAEKNYRAAVKYLFELRDTCNHNIVETKYGSGECTDCGHKIGGWYCPDSPNHECEYSESNDWCDYCGQPDERK